MPGGQVYQKACLVQNSKKLEKSVTQETFPSLSSLLPSAPPSVEQQELKNKLVNSTKKKLVTIRLE